MRSTSPSNSPVEVSATELRPALAALARVIPAPRRGIPATTDLLLAEPSGPGILRLTAAAPGWFLTADVPARIAGSRAPFLVSLAGLREGLQGARGFVPVPVEPGPPPEARFPARPRAGGDAVALEPGAVRAIHRALACASSDPTRHILNGAFLEPRDRSLHVTGTDGRHLYTAGPFPTGTSGLAGPVILPAHKVWSSPLLKAPGTAWSLRTADQGWVRIDAPGWSLLVKPLEGNYPRYDQVIPDASAFRTGAVLPAPRAAELAKVVAALPPGKEPGQLSVGLSIGKRGLVLLPRVRPDQPARPRPVEGATCRGEAVTVHLAPRYLAKALAWGFLRIEVIDAVSPVKFHRDQEIMIIMPVRVPDEVRAPERKRREPHPEPPEPPAARPPDRRADPPVALPPKPDPDPIALAARQLAEARTALRNAETTLREARRGQRDSERRMRTLRGTLRGLRNLGL